jgi:hypothetical protein
VEIASKETPLFIRVLSCFLSNEPKRMEYKLDFSLGGAPNEDEEDGGM